jgi:hypothetical protein
MKILGTAHGNKNDLHFQIKRGNIGTFRGVLFFNSTYVCITNFSSKEEVFKKLKEDFLEKDFILFTNKIFKKRTRGGEKQFRYFLMNKYPFLVLGE